MRFLVIMKMATVMISTTMKAVFLMEEIAVDLMSTHNTAQNAYALKKEKEEAVELHHLLELQLVETAISILEMGIVMISTTI